MIVIDTKISPPDETLVESETAKGNRVVHVPALCEVPTEIAFDLVGFEAAFVGSPRAARLAQTQLENFHGAIFCAGKKTAQIVLQWGISVAGAGAGNGIESDFERFLKFRRLENWAWISASETSADLTALAQKFALKIRHFAVYETLPAAVDKNFLNGLEHPVCWNFYSGKGVKALREFVRKEDVVNLYGISARKAFAAG